MKKNVFNVWAFSLLILVSVFFSCQQEKQNSQITINVSANEVLMGQTITVDATIKSIPDGNQMILLPFVNGRRWGSHEFANKEGKATFLLPMPNPGPALLEVIAVSSDTSYWQGLKDRRLLRIGTYLPDSVKIKSEQKLINVKNRIIQPHDTNGALFGIQWEGCFSPTRSWGTAQAIPIMGMYDSTIPEVYRQQILWFMDMGVDFIISDWSNHIWGKKHWTERGGGADGIMHYTQMFLETLADMRDEGLPVPKLVIMPGLSNGPPTTMEAINEQLEWIYQDYLRNPRFKDLWLIYDGKPLIIILDTAALADKRARTEASFRVPFFKWTMTRERDSGKFNEAIIDEMRQKQGPVDETHFTVRWMSSQNQTTRHHELGYWSWMDGCLKPLVTYKDGKAEVVTVTPSLFAHYGWKAPEAYGRRSGWTYLESFKTALEYRPSVIMLHQFNEYWGAENEKGRTTYMDSYSVEYSDDIEPTSLTAPGYRGDKGGWGFFYLNMTRALMDIYRGKADDVTLLAVNLNDSTGTDLKLQWTTIGVEPKSFTVSLDGKTVIEETKDLECSIPVAGLSHGEHKVSVKANGAITRYELALTHFDEVLREPVPVIVEKVFQVK